MELEPASHSWKERYAAGGVGAPRSSSKGFGLMPSILLDV